ncbi:hypothetical protein Zm00014a_035496 [Zea mays]|uniref:Uncharacterized protein n=1 Tax=Zea mays TaxID=4577 RepID=A0A3L6ELB1_MAIZE|nr:hypothetical protein Zm00014a_035496 [Zea mays]
MGGAALRRGRAGERCDGVGGAQGRAGDEERPCASGRVEAALPGREIVTSFVVDFRAFVKMLVAKFWSKEDHCNPRWTRCQESNTLLATQSNKRIISGDNTRCHV